MANRQRFWTFDDEQGFSATVLNAAATVCRTKPGVQAAESVYADMLFPVRGPLFGVPDDRVNITDVAATALSAERPDDDPVGITDDLDVVLAPPVEGLIAYSFDEGSGTTATNSGVGGPALSGVPGWAAGHGGAGSALSASASSGASYDLAAPTGTTWTLMGWVRPHGTGTWAAVWEQLDAQVFLDYNAVLSLGFLAPGPISLNAGIRTEDVWVHVAVVSQAGVGMRMVVDGVTTDTSGSTYDLPAGTYTLGGSVAEPYTGDVDDFRLIVGRALTNSQIASAASYPVPFTASGVLSAAPADPVGITDLASPTQALTRAVDDPVGVLDAAVLARGLQLGESLTGSDATVLARTTQLADPVGVADALTVERTVALADAAGATDAVALARPVSLADPVGVLDVAAAVGTTVLVSADSVVATDAVTLARESALADSAGITDIAGATVAADRLITDIAGATDALALAVTRTHNDQVAIDDEAEVEATVRRTAADQVALTDAAVAELAHGVPLADPVGVTDTAAAVLAAGAQLDDVVALTDGVTVVLHRHVDLAELVALTDTASAGVLHEVALADAVGVTDAVAVDLRVEGAIDYDAAHIVWLDHPSPHAVFTPAPRPHVVVVSTGRTHTVIRTYLTHAVLLPRPARHLVLTTPGAPHVVWIDEGSNEAP